MLIHNHAVIHAAAVLTAFFTLFVIKSPVNQFLVEKKRVILNYQGRSVAQGAGLMLIFPCITGLLPYMIVGFRLEHLLYLAVVFALSLAGLADDTLGDSSAKGFSGHGRTLLKGRFSTGAMKAFIGGFAGLLISLILNTGFWLFFLNILVFALCVNLMNLLDLRPGRSIKVLLVLVILIALFSGMGQIWILLPLAAALPLYLQGELQERYMLGDTGANLIGAILGLFAVMSLGGEGKVAFGLSLAAIHILAEFTSLSRLIDAIPVLRALDMAGRRNERGGDQR